LWTQLKTQLQSQLDDALRKKLWAQLRHELWTNIGNQEREYQLGNRFYNHSMDNRRKNAELRRVLIQEIGYARIADELQADELDSRAEYTLLKIDRADIEPIYLLKMTCPSTEYIHALRVPPNLQSAREAIR